MNEKIAGQIERMKEQTIGVEIEMNNITREKAAMLAAFYFGTCRYENTAERNGYFTWSAWDEQGREWKFQKDVSITGIDSEKCELVTPILTYADMETLQELIRQLRHAGAKSDATRGCGVHIHIGAKGHTPQTMRNLANIMASHEDLIAKALDLDHRRMSRYCRTVDPEFLKQVNKKKPKTMSQLADIWYGSQGCNYGRSQHYNDSRYHMLNYHATFTKGTIEFRLFQFDAPADGKLNGLHAGQLKAYIQLCLALSEMAKTIKSASAKPQQNENPKYAMRTWLLRLPLEDLNLDAALLLMYSVKRAYREKGAVFVMSEEAYRILRKEKVRDGRYVWATELQDGEPDTLFGVPVYVSKDMPELASGNAVILYGDFSYFWIGDRGKRKIKRLEERYAEQGLVAFITSERVDAKLVIPEAVKTLKIK